MPGELEKVDAPISGEVLPAVGDLTPQQMEAVMYDAMGRTRTEIAEAVGVSQSTIKEWRKLEAYQAEKTRILQQEGDKLAEPIKKLRADIVDGANEAVATLRDALGAEDSRGRPAWAIRVQAANELLKRGYELSNEERELLGGRVPGGGGSSKGATVIAIKIDS